MAGAGYSYSDQSANTNAAADNSNLSGGSITGPLDINFGGGSVSSGLSTTQIALIAAVVLAAIWMMGRK
jgi:hypothetical protein